MDQLKPSLANSSPLTPLGFLDRAAIVYGDCISVIYNKTSYTWSQTQRRCLKLASSLVSLGIKPGDVVSVIAPNIPAMYELHFAVPMSGAILHTINTRLDARTVSIILRHSDSKFLFVDYLSRSLVLEAIALFPQNSRFQIPLLIFITDEETPLNPFPNFDSDRTYEALIAKGDPEFKWLLPENDLTPMVLNYTSGTTSAPKGVVHCHKGLFIATLISLIGWSVPTHPVYLWTLPLFHANGWCFSWGMAAVGGTNICIRRFDADTIYGLIRKHGVTHMCGAPVVLNMLANSPNRKQLTNPVHIITAGAPPPVSVLLRTEALGFEVTHAYGLTEACGTVLSCAWKREWNRFPATARARLKARQGVRSIGMSEVDVIDPETGASVKRDGSSLGEIVLRGAFVMLGYLKDPVATAKSMKDGWFFTGDVAVMHPDGYIEIRDRSKDVIISGGENLSSVEVESVLYSFPAINEAAVVARPDEFWGETPCAFLSLKNDEKKPSEKEIIEFCRARLPHYMVPKTIVFSPDLPKTSTGKIRKSDLRDMAKDLGPSRESRM